MKFKNIYHESEAILEDLRKGFIPTKSIITVQWPSGAKQSIRYHDYTHERDKLIGCDMGWDNQACEEYDLKKAVILKVEHDKKLH